MALRFVQRPPGMIPEAAGEASHASQAVPDCCITTSVWRRPVACPSPAWSVYDPRRLVPFGRDAVIGSLAPRFGTAVILRR